jgi:hypothetical protein
MASRLSASRTSLTSAHLYLWKPERVRRAYYFATAGLTLGGGGAARPAPAAAPGYGNRPAQQMATCCTQVGTPCGMDSLPHGERATRRYTLATSIQINQTITMALTKLRPLPGAGRWCVACFCFFATQKGAGSNPVLRLHGFTHGISAHL